MSLEAAIQENTAAIRQLIAALANQPLPLVAQDALAYAQAKAVDVEPPVAEPVQDKPVGKSKAAKPAATPPVTPSPAASVETAPPPSEPAAPVQQALSYDAIKVPFLTQLVAKKGREAGAALLREFGVADGGKLSDIPEARWPEVLEAINARVS